MKRVLPQQIEPMALARRGASLDGVLPFSKMPQLSEVLLDATGEAEVTLHFGMSKFLPPTVTGQIKAKIVLECQRCAGPLEMDLDVRPELRIVSSELQIKNLRSGEEPLLTVDDMVDLVKLVEDEILLNLPMIAKHENEDCVVQLPYELN